MGMREMNEVHELLFFVREAALRAEKDNETIRKAVYWAKTAVDDLQQNKLEQSVNAAKLSLEYVEGAAWSAVWIVKFLQAAL